MEFECFKTDDEQEESEQKLLTIRDVYFHVYGWAGCYDDPWGAWAYGTVTSPNYCGSDFWHQWQHEHWVGHNDVEERALADPLVRKQLVKHGLIHEEG